MLDEFRGTSPADVARELVGTVLRHVYPGRLRPTDVWSYAAGPGSPHGGRFDQFWSELEQRCPDEDLPELLDGLAHVIDSLRPILDAQYRNELPNTCSHGLLRPTARQLRRRDSPAGSVPVWTSTARSSITEPGPRSTRSESERGLRPIPKSEPP